MDFPKFSEWFKAAARRPVLTKRLNRVLRVITRVLSVVLAGGSTLPGRAAMNGQFIYAAQDDGTIHVYDINHSHGAVKTNRVFSPSGDVRGACASAATHRFYVMYNLNSTGYVACVDLTNDNVLWNRAEHSPGVDRGVVTPDGKSLYLPTLASDLNSPYALVVDALTGNLTNQIPMPPQTHDFICSLDGTKVFMSNKSSDQRIRTVWTASNQVTNTTGMFGGIVQPFSVNGRNTLILVDVEGIYGFQYADLITGQILGSALFTGTSAKSSTPEPHGIGFTPDEHEAWACDVGSGNPYVHVFDITTLPPTQTRLVTLSHENPHWLTFSIDGRYCYVAGPKSAGQTTDIIDASTYNRIGSLSPSEDVLEVDFNNGTVTRTGDQYGLGRLTNSAPKPPDLSLGRSSNRSVLKWPAWASDYAVLFTTNLGGRIAWLTATSSLSLTNGHYTMTLTNNGTRGFYRLKKP
jgi:DNA-binding beta-propeller fold protein YncE